MAEQLLGAMAVLNGYAPALRFIADGPIIVDPLIATDSRSATTPMPSKWFALAKDARFKSRITGNSDHAAYLCLPR